MNKVRLLLLVLAMPLLFFLLSGLQESALAESSVADWQAYAKAADESLALGDFAAAESKLRSAIAGCSEKAELVKLQVNYTNAIMSQGKFDAAARELKKAISLSKSVCGQESSDYAEAMDLQSWFHQANGKMDAAAASLKIAISILEKTAPGSSDLGDAYQHMGLIDESLGLYEPSENNYAKALAIREKLHGAESMAALDLREALANIALKRGNSTKASGEFMEVLKLKESHAAPLQPYSPGPSERTVVFRFNQGAPNCKQGIYEGAVVQSISANGVTVQASLSKNKNEFNKGTQALVKVMNQSNVDLDFLPRPATFIQIRPKVTVLEPLDAAELAQRIEKKGESKAKWIRFWGADAMTTVTGTSYAQGRGVPVYGYVPGSFAWNNGYNLGNTYQAAPNFSRNRWSTSSATTMMVPDYQAREEALRKAREATERSKSQAQSLRDTALGASKLKAQDSLAGTLDFQFSKYESAILRIPVGNAVFEFGFE